jgi:predicted AAA+ superfamily ATPase
MPSRSRNFPRYLSARLREALADTPVVLIHGPRQSGKTTLARAVGERRGYRYFSFDNDAARSAARQDPAGFVAGLPERSILDEVQRVPAGSCSPGRRTFCWCPGLPIRSPAAWAS